MPVTTVVTVTCDAGTDPNVTALFSITRLRVVLSTLETTPPPPSLSLSLSLCLSPCLCRSPCLSNGGQGYLMSPPVWNLRAVIWFYLLSCSSAYSHCSFCLVLFLFDCRFSWQFSPENSSIFFVKRWAFWYRSCLAELGDDSWSVVCAAYCRMALVFAIMRLYNFQKVVSVHSSFLRLKSLVSINQTKVHDARMS